MSEGRGKKKRRLQRLTDYNKTLCLHKLWNVVLIMSLLPEKDWANNEIKKTMNDYFLLALRDKI